jgi:hypothetical protein
LIEDHTMRKFLLCGFLLVAAVIARAETIISEDFESVALGYPPVGWEQQDVDGGYSSWFQRPSRWEVFARENFPAHSGTRMAVCFFNDGNVPNNDWLILPPQTLLAPIVLRYWASSQDPGFLESFEVRVSTTDADPASFTHLVSMHINVPEAWTEYTDDLSAFAGQTFYIAFHYNSVNRFMLKLDDISLDATWAPGGVIAGAVTDSAGIPVDNAVVQVWGINRELHTDSTGRFLFSHVPPDQYDMGFLNEFYYSHLESPVNVAVDETTFVNVSLALLPLRFMDYVSNSSPRHITDYDTFTIFVYETIHDTVLIYDLDITLNLTHSYVGDLDIWLKSPAEKVVLLARHDPYDNGVNITRCRFDDEAALDFSAGRPPWSGRFRPLQPLSAYRGDSTIVSRRTHWIGTWTLGVADLSAGNGGYLNSFVMHVAWLTGEVGAPPRPASRPTQFSFDGNYPNPFNSETRFRFYLGRAAPARLTLFNLLGQDVAHLLDEKLPAGEHTVVFDASRLASGVYIARLQAATFTATSKMVLIK